MKKILIILSCIFLCSAIVCCNHIEEDPYEHLWKGVTSSTSADKPSDESSNMAISLPDVFSENESDTETDSRNESQSDVPESDISIEISEPSEEPSKKPDPVSKDESKHSEPSKQPEDTSKETSAEASEPDEPIPHFDVSVDISDDMEIYLPGNWTYTQSGSYAIDASSNDKLMSITVVTSELENAKGLTEELFVDKMVDELPGQLASRGKFKVSKTSATISDKKHPAISVINLAEGGTIQQQCFLIKNSVLYTVTVTGATTAKAKSLWNYIIFID